METLLDANRAITDDLPRGSLKQTHWGEAARSLMIAAETGITADIKYATDQILRAIKQEGWTILYGPPSDVSDEADHNPRVESQSVSIGNGSYPLVPRSLLEERAPQLRNALADLERKIVQMGKIAKIADRVWAQIKKPPRVVEVKRIVAFSAERSPVSFGTTDMAEHMAAQPSSHSVAAAQSNARLNVASDVECEIVRTGEAVHISDNDHIKPQSPAIEEKGHLGDRYSERVQPDHTMLYRFFRDVLALISEFAILTNRHSLLIARKAFAGGKKFVLSILLGLLSLGGLMGFVLLARVAGMNSELLMLKSELAATKLRMTRAEKAIGEVAKPQEEAISSRPRVEVRPSRSPLTLTDLERRLIRDFVKVPPRRRGRNRSFRREISSRMPFCRHFQINWYKSYPS